MFVHFKLKEVATKAHLIAAVTEEYTGYEQSCYSFARLLVWDGETLKEFSGQEKFGKIINLNIDDEENPDKLTYVTNGTVLYWNDLTAYPDQMTWITAMSGFRYELFEGNNCTYIGADRGFLAQNLLAPCFKENIEILFVGGTHGSFTGPEALKDYREEKRKERERMTNCLMPSPL
jgi:hypothetical protein